MQVTNVKISILFNWLSENNFMYVQTSREGLLYKNNNISVLIYFYFSWDDINVKISNETNNEYAYAADRMRTKIEYELSLDNAVKDVTI